jgi:phospholipid/cholesterol/gamma-HCH transport system substrate-binding protein
VRRRPSQWSHARWGLAALIVLVVATFFAFTKQVPFQDHHEVHAVVQTANGLRPGSLVRIAGVNVGQVHRVESLGDGRRAARVTMRIDEHGLPLHRDAQLKIRPRILFEGNFFVDLQPGSPSSPHLPEGGTIPINQTAGPVQFDEVLTALQSDTRQDLRVVLDELDRAYSGGGAQAYNRSTQYWEPAYRDSAIVNDAFLGRRDGDLSGYIRSAGRVAEALGRNERQLVSLITDLRRTAGASTVRDERLQAAIAELPRTLRAGRPALAALNDALPPLRRFVADLRPGVRATPAAIDAQLPFVRALRRAVQPSELRGLAADLRPTVPALARLNAETVPLLEQVRAASSCQNEVILPWTLDRIEDPDFPSIGPVYQEQTKPLIGLASESRSFDANGQWFRVSLNGGNIATATTPGRFLLTDRPILGVNPPRPAQRSPLRPDVPCETQQQPDLRTNPGRPPESFRVADPPAVLENEARRVAVRWLRGQTDQPVGDDLLSRVDLSRLGGLVP